MGSSEAGIQYKREHITRCSVARTEKRPCMHKHRCRISHLLMFKRIGYFQWICTVAVFLVLVVTFQMFLPGYVIEKSSDSWRERLISARDLDVLKRIGVFDFGNDIEFDYFNALEKRLSEDKKGSPLRAVKTVYGFRKPLLALVFKDLIPDPRQLLMVTLVIALREIGYTFEVFSLRKGPVQEIWRSVETPVTVLPIEGVAVDWLSYDGVIADSWETRSVLSCFLQEPFKSIPFMLTIYDKEIAIRSRNHTGPSLEHMTDWNAFFARVNMLVFSNHMLLALYSSFDAGNRVVIPGSPAAAWNAHLAPSCGKSGRARHGYGPDDTVIVVVGSQFTYRGCWLEHALILQALLPVFLDFQLNYSIHNMKIGIHSGDSNNNYSSAIESISSNLGYPKGSVKQTVTDDAESSVLAAADVVIYGSFFDERVFPEILAHAMCLGKLVIAPDIPMIKKYVIDRVNGFLFSKNDIFALKQIMLEVFFDGKLSPFAAKIASTGKHNAKNMMAQEAVEGYASLLENLLEFPSDVSPPQTAEEIPPSMKTEWRWDLFREFLNCTCGNRTLRSYNYLVELEVQFNQTWSKHSGSITSVSDSFSYDIWKDEKNNELINDRIWREEEEIRDRTHQPQVSWEEVYRNAKRIDRIRNDLHERNEGELERTGQPLCIYEPYYGEGTWSFLHNTSLYRGIGLSTRGRRPQTDDIDASSRLPLLKDPYYCDVLDAHGALFAISNRIDRLHKNAWIGFQSWRATSRKASLSETAESALLSAIETERHGDALYFWVPVNTNRRMCPQQGFWSFCDAINAGNCKATFVSTFRRMYNIKNDFNSLPPMPNDSCAWSGTLALALPTRSFLEYVMFSRMFVDALDAQFYDRHHQSLECPLSLHKDKHCYSRLLELLINVWAYHSARRMVYLNPETGEMLEQHRFQCRKGRMWVKWFSYTTLKSMDEELAEEADLDRNGRRWIWPLTGEVVWQGVYDKERNLRISQKEKRRQKSKDKISRMRRKHHQQVIGKYVKPPPEDIETVNSTSQLP